LDDIDPLTGLPKCYPITGTGDGGVTINTIGTNLQLASETSYLYNYYFFTPGIVKAAGAENGILFQRWRPNSGVSTGLIGFEGVGGFGTLPGGDPDGEVFAMSLNIRDTFEPRMLNASLISGAKIYTGFLQGSYELKAMGNAEIYGEVLANRRESEQIGYRQLTLDYPQFSPLIPASLQFIETQDPSDPTQTFLRRIRFSGPQATSGGDPVGIRAFIGFGNDRSHQEVDYVKANGGIRGELGFGDWRYDLNLSYAKSDASYTFDSFLIDKLTYATHAVAAPAGFSGPTRGGLTCAINLTNPGENCIVAPALNSQTIGGILPQDFKDYIFRPVTGHTTYQETILSGQVDGTLFSYGDDKKVSAVVGIEYRDAKINDTPSIESQNANLLNFTSSAPTRGNDSVVEIYTELESTILEDVPGAKELTLNVSGRYTNYDSYGSDWTYKVGGIYTPVDWVSFRATYGTSYRAPALFEQFQGATTGFFDQDFDPCNNYGAPGKNPILVANCTAENLPRGGNFQATSGITVINQGGAAAGLEAETSDNFTAGIIFQTDVGNDYGRLAFAVDYYNIQIDNGVAQIGAAAILALCYNDPDFRAGGSYCGLVEARDPVTFALTVSDSYTNVSTQTVEGIDYNLRYEVDLYGGTLLFNAEVTQYLEQGFQLLPTDEMDDYNGTLNTPDWTGDFDLSYTKDGFRVRYEVEWIGSMSSYGFLNDEERATSNFDLDVPNYYLHNLSVQYTDEEAQWSAIVGVRNMFDKEPPTISSQFYDRVGNSPLYSGYDYLGREFFVNISKSF
ncbi:MAG: TonB-dependent receptor, partial [Alphaproteobacteria bacterium]|nr:TonB-dependent receptor [Alphaproteobacteria bacterium]